MISSILCSSTAIVSIAILYYSFFFFFSSRRRHTRCGRDWSSDVCSSDLKAASPPPPSPSPVAEKLIEEVVPEPDESLEIETTSLVDEAPGGSGSGMLEEIGRASCRERV